MNKITKISERLDLIVSLSDNWDGYGACEIDKIVANNLRFILKTLDPNFIYSIKVSNIIPTANGTIMLEWNTKDAYLLLDIGEKYATLVANFDDDTNAAIDRIEFTKNDVSEITENLHKFYDTQA